MDAMKVRLTRRTPRAAALTAFCLMLTLAQVAASAAQLRKREPLTPQEIEMVREAQQLDARTALFVKIAERRLAAVTGAEQKQSAVSWGELPKGTRAEYLADFAGILDEAIENVDDTASRSPESPQLDKSVRKLAEAAARFLAQLTPLRETIEDGPERESLERGLDNLRQVIEAAKKAPEEKDEKKAGKKG
jgi:transcriptional regulator of heat shock response